jgi:hypothetical protein
LVGGFEFDRLAFHEEESLRLRRPVEKAQGVLPIFVPGNPDEFVQDGRLHFTSGFPVAGTDPPGNGFFSCIVTNFCITKYISCIR